MDLKSFARRIDVLAERVETGSASLHKATGLAVDQTVVLATPVNEGRARSNWQVGVGIAPSEVIEPYAPGSGGNTGAQNAQAAIEQGKIAISTAPPGQDIHITNNLSYIGALNDGHSAQAPAGFVELAIQAGVQTVRSKKILS